MKKALHDNQKIFLKLKEGEYSSWDGKSVEVLIEMVNNVHAYELMDNKEYQGFKVGSILRPFDTLSFEELMSLLTRKFLCRYIEDPSNSILIDDLNDMLEKLRFRHVLIPSKSGYPSWEFIVDFTQEMLPDEAAAVLFSHLLSIGALTNVRRCEMKECSRFFVGRPNTKWCSKSCGGKYRVRKKRKRDLE
jgi:hypothetical protein